MAGEKKGAVPSAGDWLGRQNGSDDADQSAVCAVGADRIPDHVEFRFVFVGNAAAMRLVPVNYELPALTVADDVFADIVEFTVDVGHVDVSRGLKSPACAREAVLGRMNGLSSALGREVTDEQADRNGWVDL